MKYLLITKSGIRTTCNTREELNVEFKKRGTKGWRQKLIEEGDLQVFEITGEITDTFREK